MEHISIGDKVNVIENEIVMRKGIVVDWINTGSGRVILVRSIGNIPEYSIHEQKELEVI